MKLEDQVVSLKLAKRLKELGVKQESKFFWIRTFNGQTGEPTANFKVAYQDCLENISYGTKRHELMYSAFTVAELGEMLPNWIFTQKHFGESDDWWVYADPEPKDFPAPKGGIYANTEADARAEMLIYLLENKLTQPPKA